VDVRVYDDGIENLAMRRRRSSTLGKNEPWPSFGILNSAPPAFVVRTGGREPFRWLVRIIVRPWRSVWTPLVASVSISAS